MVGGPVVGLALLPTAVLWLRRQYKGWQAQKSRRSKLPPGESLKVSESVYSPDGRTKLTLLDERLPASERAPGGR